MDLNAVCAAVDDAFRTTGAQTPPWPDPHPGWQRPGDDEYSRITDPAKYRIVGARAEAWVQALTALRLATVSPTADVRTVWRDRKPQRGNISHARWVQPLRADAVALLVCTSGFDGLTDNGVILGAGTPAVEIALLPDCGCDACDPGSAELIEELDERILDVITGAFTHVTTPHGNVQADREGWSATGPQASDQAEQLLADARANRSAYPVIAGAAWW